MYAFTRSLPRLLGTLQSMVDSCSNAALGIALSDRYMARLSAHIEKFSKYQGLVEHVVDFDRLPDLEVSPRHDPELAELRDETDEMEEEVSRYDNE